MCDIGFHRRGIIPRICVACAEIKVLFLSPLGTGSWEWISFIDQQTGQDCLTTERHVRIVRRFACLAGLTRETTGFCLNQICEISTFLDLQAFDILGRDLRTERNISPLNLLAVKYCDLTYGCMHFILGVQRPNFLFLRDFKTRTSWLRD